MTLLNAKFPLFGIRRYHFIDKQEPYTLVHTKFATYVLDMPSAEGDLAARRMKAMTMDAGYKLYPLKERYSSLAAVINSSRTTFIDSNGKILNRSHDNKKRYNCIYERVLNYSQTYDGNYLVHTIKGSFITPEITNYVVLIRVQRSFVLLDTADSKENPRRWIML